MLAKRVPNPLDALFKRLLLVLSGSLATITLLGDEMWLLPLAVAAVGGCHTTTGLLMGIDVLRRAGSSAQLVGAVSVTAINLWIMPGALAGGFLIDKHWAAGGELCATGLDCPNPFATTTSHKLSLGLRAKAALIGEKCC